MNTIAVWIAARDGLAELVLRAATLARTAILLMVHISLVVTPWESYAGEVLSGDASIFKGTIAVNAKDSKPDWKTPLAAPLGAPNVVLVMLDDVGFADTSTFGGVARTPVLDQLAAEGLRYNQFHTTGICSPTRASLLSGRNAHRIGYGGFGGVGFPGYDGIWKRSAVSVAEVLRRNGYSTAAFGKWHNTPYYEISPIGPFDRWPTHLGFEYFYGFMLGASSQWEPTLWRDTEMVAPPTTAEHGYYFTTDITDEAIRWVHTHDALAPERPYFIYFAPGAAHYPHHVSDDWIEPYRGKFDEGWDEIRQQIFVRQKKLGVIPPGAVLTPRPKELPAWRSLSHDQKQLLARQMEVFAAFIAKTDHEIGRLIQAVKDGPRSDNTLILFIVGDNGPEAWSGIEGSVSGMGTSIRERSQRKEELGSVQHLNGYSAGWAWVGSTPFQWMKHIASHLGGTRNPMVISWPARIKDHGGIRSQFAHVNDVAATLYEAAGVQFPEVVDGVSQVPLDGVSLVNTFDSAAAPDHHRVQYFEAEGNRAIYSDGWLASARHFVPWVPSKENTYLQPSQSDFGRDSWELYHLTEDFSQAHDLALQNPRKLRELQALFDVEARNNYVYPLGAGSMLERPPAWSQAKRKFVFYPGFPVTLLKPIFPDLTQSHRITADVVIPESGSNGTLLALGNRYNGAVLYVKDDRLVYENNVGHIHRETIVSSDPLPNGRAKIVFELDRENAGTAMAIGRLYTNGARVGEGPLTPNPMPYFSVIDVGKNSVSPVSDAYTIPFVFTGIIEKLTLEVLSTAADGSQRPNSD